MSASDSAGNDSLALIRLVVRTLDDKKATDIRVFEPGPKSSVADYVVVATGTSDPHLRAIGNELDKTFDEQNVKIGGVESQPESGWTVVDAFNVIVHIFRADQRVNFQIEKLYKDVKELSVKGFLPAAASPVSDQAVSITAKLKPVAKPSKKTPPAPKKEAKIIVRKSIAGRTAAIKSKPEFEKTPNKKRTVKQAAKIAAKVKAKQKPAPKGSAKAKAAAEAAVPAKKKAVVAKPASRAVKKIIKQKADKVAKAVRGIAKQKAKSGVVTRKAKR